MATGKFISYLRVSTDRQGMSGLGLEAQRAAVAGYLNGGSWQHVAEFVEIESGRKNGRPMLAKALDACRLHGATLVIARLDRLARNASFLLGLKDAGVDFVAVDQPFANRLVVGILALVAEAEAEAISARTKAALAAAKARGVRLGSPRQNATEAGRRLGNERGIATSRARADQQAKRLRATIAELNEAGITSARAVAAALNNRGIPAPRGGVWSQPQVSRVLDRLAA